MSSLPPKCRLDLMVVEAKCSLICLPLAGCFDNLSAFRVICSCSSSTSIFLSSTNLRHRLLSRPISPPILACAANLKSRNVCSEKALSSRFNFAPFLYLYIASSLNALTCSVICSPQYQNPLSFDIYQQLSEHQEELRPQMWNLAMIVLKDWANVHRADIS